MIIGDRHKLPAFVKCTDNSENLVCEPGVVYCTLEPVTEQKASDFWSKTLLLFPSEFKEATVDEYISQNEVFKRDTSFDSIEVHEMDSAFPDLQAHLKKTAIKPAAKAIIKDKPAPAIVYPRYVVCLSDSIGYGFLQNEVYDTQTEFTPDLWATVWANGASSFREIRQWEFELKRPGVWAHRINRKT
jgi:hypothetical protein